MKTTIQKYLQIKLMWSDKIRVTKETTIPMVENCLYAAYGNSMAYGQQSLLYIGQTSDLARRMGEHLEGTLKPVTDLHISVGVFAMPLAQLSDIAYLKDVSEKLLINLLKPSYNSANINELGSKAKKDVLIHVLNYGNRYDLPLEVTNVHWYK